MPNQRKAGTRPHNFACEDALWDEAKETAARVGTQLSTVLREALEVFIASNALESPKATPAPIDLFLTQDPPACPACGSGLGWPPKEAAWAHMETCPGLVDLARQAGII